MIRNIGEDAEAKMFYEVCVKKHIAQLFVPLTIFRIPVITRIVANNQHNIRIDQEGRRILSKKERVIFKRSKTTFDEVDIVLISVYTKSYKRIRNGKISRASDNDNCVFKGRYWLSERKSNSNKNPQPMSRSFIVK